MTTHISNTHRFYTYIYFDPRSNPPEPFYVGKGTNTRYKSHLRDAYNNVNHPKVRKIQAIWNADLEPIIEIIPNLTEDGSLELEDFIASLIGSNFIEEYKDGPLTNMIECGKLGGSLPGDMNGMYGKTHSDESIQLMSDKRSNLVPVKNLETSEIYMVTREEWKVDNKLVAESKGRKWSEEQKNNIKNSKNRPEAIKNMCIAQQKYHKENPRKWMNKNKVNKMILTWEIDQHLNTGWILGRYNNFKQHIQIDKKWLENELTVRSIQSIAKDGVYSLDVLRSNMKKYNLKNYTNTKYYNLYHKDIGLLSNKLSRKEICKISQSLLRLKSSDFLGSNVNSKGELKKRFAVHLVGLYVKLI